MAGRRFEWSFLKAEVAFPILGADFLAGHNLSVDLANMRLVPGCDGPALPLSAYTEAVSSASIGVVAITDWRKTKEHQGATRNNRTSATLYPHLKSQHRAGESEKRSSSGDLGYQPVPRIPKAGEGRVAKQSVLKIRLSGGEGRAYTVKEKTSQYYSKEYRDSPSKRWPLATERAAPPHLVHRRGRLAPEYNSRPWTHSSSNLDMEETTCGQSRGQHTILTMQPFLENLRPW